MALEKVTLEQLARMDGGRAGALFGRALDRCYADCEDLPTLDKPRKITLVVTVRPVATENGKALDSVSIETSCKEALPTRTTREYNAVADRDGIYVNDMSPDRARQRTIDEDRPLRPAKGGE